MPSSMYNNSIPAFIRSLNNLSAIMTKAETWAAGKKIDQNVLVNLRLVADMLPFSKQIQIASDGIKAFAARVAGVEIPSFPDTESNITELQERIAKTIKFLQSFKPEQIDGAEAKEIRFKTGSGTNERVFNGLDYLNLFVIPNFYFHVTTAYAILRHNGLEIGKGDYLGSF